ncbi:MAG: DUF1841 family protein [Pseudomonadota bacterium]|nr:MAG: DUF1841 family protein [Pseudomonadota bacterium]
MFEGASRETLRAVFFRAWQRQQRGEPLEGAEALIVRVAQLHPEYHHVLAAPDRYTDQDYLPEVGKTNPFLHMAMHISIEEQLALDQPRGVRAHYQRLLQALPDEHAVQHAMMECLGEMLWQAARAGGVHSEKLYLDCLARLATATRR